MNFIQLDNIFLNLDNVIKIEYNCGQSPIKNRYEFNFININHISEKFLLNKTQIFRLLREIGVSFDLTKDHHWQWLNIKVPMGEV